MHEDFMKIALEEANKAFSIGEVPIGAVLVRDNCIIATAHNLVETKKCATAHAELLCLQRAEKKDWRLTDCTLYTTLEPCAMCLGALLLSRVGTLVYGAPDLRHGAAGSWVDLLAKKHPTHTLEVVRGVLEEEASTLLKTFFRGRRAGTLRRADCAAERETSSLS